nr:unnamed protein product [Digitaria exilis]
MPPCLSTRSAKANLSLSLPKYPKSRRKSTDESPNISIRRSEAGRRRLSWSCFVAGASQSPSEPRTTVRAPAASRPSRRRSRSRSSAWSAAAPQASALWRRAGASAVRSHGRKSSATAKSTERASTRMARGPGSPITTLSPGIVGARDDEEKAGAEGGRSLAGAEAGGGVVATHEGEAGGRRAEREEDQLPDPLGLHGGGSARQG